MKKPTIAEILHYAADKKLANNVKQYWYSEGGGNKEKFSCCAVEEAVRDLHPHLAYWDRDEIFDRISAGLKNMGCPVDSTDAFENDVLFNDKNQQTRYAWLKFAATMAEEQGV